jgi:quercetin dioxygenase-like cupin family protein
VDESYYVLEGKYELLLGERMVVAGPGSYVFIPRGTLHTYANRRTKSARMLTFLTSGRLEGYFRKVRQPARFGEPAPAVGPEDVRRLVTFGDEYGISFPTLPKHHNQGGDHHRMTIPTSPSPTLPLVLPPGAGERIWITGDTMQFKATAAETHGAYILIENIAPPGSGPPPHVHKNEDETLYVLDGDFEILLGKQLVRAEPGAFAFVPRGTVHRFRCVGDRPGRILLLFTPAGLEGFFREAECARPEMAPRHQWTLQKLLARKSLACATGCASLTGPVDPWNHTGRLAGRSSSVNWLTDDKLTVPRLGSFI